MQLRTRRSVAISGLIALSSAAGAHAQVQPIPSSTTAASSQGDIVVTARKISESIQKVPESITAFTGAMLEAQNVKSVYDVQRETPNLVLQGIGAEPQALTLSLRGQRQNDIVLTADPSVGIYIDGLYYPRTLGLRNALVDVARVEVLRGPQGTLYGRNTTGGALSIYSNDPGSEIEGSAYASYGNYNAYEMVGIVNLPIAKDVALRVTAQHNEHGGYGQDALGRELADETNTFVRAKLKVGIGERITALMFGSYSRGRNGGAIIKTAGVNTRNNPPGVTTTLTQITLERGLPVTAANLASSSAVLQSYVLGDPYRTNGTSPSYSFFKGYTLGLDLSFEVTDAISLRSISGYQDLDRSNRTDLDATPFTIIDVTRLTKDHFASEELQLLGNTGPLKWVTGLYVSHEQGTEISPNTSLPLVSATTPATNVSAITNSSYAFFGQGTLNITDRIRLTGGARYSIDDRQLEASNFNRAGCVVPAPGILTRVITGSAQTLCPRDFHVTFDGTSWLASLDYQATRDVLFYGKVARGYRTGGINQRGANTIESFATFNPETVTEYEVGMKGSFFDHIVRLNLAAYYDDYKDIQRSTSRLTANGIQTFLQNAAAGRIAGYEAELTLRPTSQLTLSAASGLADGKYFSFLDSTIGDRSGETFGIPRFTASGSARYVQPTSVGDLAFQVDYSHRSSAVLTPEVPTQSQLTQPAYGLLSARVSLNIDRIGTELAVFGRNLAQTVYYDGSGNMENSLGYNYKITGEPRTFGVSVKKTF